MKFILCVLVGVVCSKLVSSVSVEEDLRLTLREKQTLDKRKGSTTAKGKVPENRYLFDPMVERSVVSTARNFNIDDAENMLKENLRWRKEKKIDTIHLEDFEDMEKDFHESINTYDKEGRPIGVVDIGTWDIRAAIIQGRGQRLLRYLDRLMENATDQVFERQERGMNVTQWKVLINADGFNLITHACPRCIPVYIQFVQSLENHYPGWIDELIAVDAPTSVQVVIDILRPFLSKSSRESLRIFNSNRVNWMAYLDSRISRDERTSLYGGTKPSVEY